MKYATVTGRSLIAAALLSSLISASADAQRGRGASRGDDEARALFQAGQIAFEDARYEDALEHFRNAYRRSDRGALLYNIAVAADRLRRDEEALEAFDGFLEAEPNHELRPDAEARAAVIRRALEERRAAEAEAAQAREPVIEPETEREAAAPERQPSTSSEDRVAERGLRELQFGDPDPDPYLQLELWLGNLERLE